MNGEAVTTQPQSAYIVTGQPEAFGTFDPNVDQPTINGGNDWMTHDLAGTNAEEDKRRRENLRTPGPILVVDDGGWDLIGCIFCCTCCNCGEGDSNADTGCSACNCGCCDSDCCSGDCCTCDCSDPCDCGSCDCGGCDCGSCDCGSCDF